MIQKTIRLISMVRERGMPKTETISSLAKGVARPMVVAIPPTMERISSTSMTLPTQPLVIFSPRSMAQALLARLTSVFLTQNI